MQLENFKIFADLVETKSFSKSAKLNGITQSAVSQQARAMERHFKTLLIDRSQKQFQLTREGQRVYESANEILHTYEKLLSELQEMKKVISGTIRISTVYSIGLHELPPFIKKFLHDYPSVNVRIEYRRSNLVYEDILHNSVDFGLVAFPVKQRQIEVLPFRNDHLVLITHPQHPLAKRPEIGIQDARSDLHGRHRRSPASADGSAVRGPDGAIGVEERRPWSAAALATTSSSRRRATAAGGGAPARSARPFQASS